MDALSKTAVLEISKLVEIESKMLKIEINRGRNEIASLTEKLQLMEKLLYMAQGNRQESTAVAMMRSTPDRGLVLQPERTNPAINSSQHPEETKDRAMPGCSEPSEGATRTYCHQGGAIRCGVVISDDDATSENWKPVVVDIQVSSDVTQCPRPIRPADSQPPLFTDGFVNMNSQSPEAGESVWNLQLPSACNNLENEKAMSQNTVPSEQQFRLDYRPVLRSLGCVTEQQFEDVLVKICQEVDRRKSLDVASAERAAAIKDAYQPLHPHVYHLKECFLTPKFKHIVEYCQGTSASEEGLLEHLDEVPGQRVYRFPVFEKQFCEELLQELEHFERSAAPKGRPNTMNHYGILLNELGFDRGFISPLREQYLHPITSLLYPDCGGQCLDSQKAFVVKYDMHEDLDLCYHYDNAEITLNVSLGKDFTEGNLYFGNMRQVPLSESECFEMTHRVTEGLLHRGQHMHGALPISSGQRWNLIIWMRASQVRNDLCPMCQRKPSLMEGVGFADGFTQNESMLNSLCLLA
ncbi:hypothetical protein WMY93_003777 [Mugilogobius chulae]|uniref:Fe2OG dioxygenase domain-containing protein n=1 Tax=Mugilogobius chulae TaxID=88201 RepID=A0AAW0PXN2_9GOBI